MINKENLFSESLNVEKLYCQAASADLDTIYLHEGMKQDDWSKFQREMKEEIEGEIKHSNFCLIKKIKIPENMKYFQEFGFSITNVVS